jgi:hypothetical protein
VSEMLNYSQDYGQSWSIAAVNFRVADESQAGLTDHKHLNFEHLREEISRVEAEHEVLAGDIRRHYNCHEEAQVFSYLRKHPVLLSLLSLAAPILKSYFDPPTPLKLRAPVDEDGWQLLYAVVMWPGGPQEASAALNRFEDEWWLPNSRQASGRLTFTYELT